jgi:lipopolysaccharide/colanic/teichoic acid biosynthesis glycosyltransferase
MMAAPIFWLPGLGSPREPTRVASALALLSEPLFRDAVIREWRRAERSDRPAVLFLITLERRLENSDDAWRRLTAAISIARRDTDVVGWFKTQHSLGVILTGERRQPLDIREIPLMRALESAAIGDFSFRLCGHSSGEKPRQGFHVLDPAIAPALDETQPRRYDLVKRLLDIVLSAILLLLLSPLLLVVAALVKLTSAGPVLYRQQRIGQMMRPFEMLKFRTMAFNAAPALHQEFVTTFIAGGDGEKPADPNRVFKIVKDPRITSIGHFLRRTSIDELPQLWNVLRGDMSLVGPRPPLAYEVAHYKAWHLRRIAGAKPGVTGLWQVKGRSRTTFDEMVRLDLRYVRRRSLWIDLQILLATPRAVISGKGAC